MCLFEVEEDRTLPGLGRTEAGRSGEEPPVEAIETRDHARNSENLHASGKS